MGGMEGEGTQDARPVREADGSLAHPSSQSERILPMAQLGTQGCSSGTGHLLGKHEASGVSSAFGPERTCKHSSVVRTRPPGLHPCVPRE